MQLEGNPPDNVNMKGWLYKWRGYIKGYQRRWFVLSNGLLSYYGGPAEVTLTCIGTISLVGAFIDREDPLNFVISSAAQTFHLRAKNKEDVQKWVVALEIAKANAIQMMEAESDEERESDYHSSLRQLTSTLDDVNTCNDLIQKHLVAIQRSLTELEENPKQVSAEKLRMVNERTTLFKITSNAMIKACKDFVELGQTQGRKWQKILLSKGDKRTTHQEETIDPLVKQHNKLENATKEERTHESSKTEDEEMESTNQEEIDYKSSPQQLTSQPDDMNTCNDLIEKRFISLQRSLTELEQNPMQDTAERSKIISVMINELQKNLQDYKHQTGQLEKDKMDSTNKTETLQIQLDCNEKVLEETIQDRDVIRSELKQCKLDFAKESRALREVLKQTNQGMAEMQKRTAEEGLREDTSYSNSEETVVTEESVLAAEFGRLIVGIADSLTLDQSLQLTMLFSLPPSVSDALCRVSLYQSPGIKFLEEIRIRDIINMYDVTNLQKAFAVLQLENIKQNLLEPYQQRVKIELHKLHKAKEMLTWEDVDALNVHNDKTAIVQVGDSKLAPEKNAVERLDDSAGAEAMTQHSETSINQRISSPKDRHHHPLYIEHNIGREGGTIHLAGVILTLPPGAILEKHVIGLGVASETPFPLPREVDKARMTPLIKLEPLGLITNKPLQLTIPHSALIPEPESHDVIIFSGQLSTKSEGHSDTITWTEETSLSKQLTEKTITVDIQCLSYLSASLLSQSSESSSYIVRAVLFVDGVKNDDEDIILTVCFCGDNEPEYSMLLSDCKTKLLIEQYSTLQVCQHSGTDEKHEDVLSLTTSTLNNSYVPDLPFEEKKVAVTHLFAASRVSHQFRLKKNQQTCSDDVDVVLTVTQAGNKLTELFLKTRIKDLIISQKSENLLLGPLPAAITPYEDLKSNISSMLEAFHCRQLAAYFELSPAEAERVENNSTPGSMLIKILDEREKIMPRKMIDLYQGLKVCHLEKIARLVSEYINLISEQSQQEEQNKTGKSTTGFSEDVPVSQHLSEKQQIEAVSSHSDCSVQTLSSSCVTCDLHVKTLTNEGFVGQEVVEALDIAKNKLDLARKVLQYIRDQRVLLPKKDIVLYKEQYIDENGGEIILQEADLHMRVPAGAVSKGGIVSITMMTSKHVALPSEGRSPQLTPVIKCGQEGITLNKPATLRIPHCASETEGLTSTDMHLGFSSKEEETRWRQRRQHESRPVLKKDHFEVMIQTFCTISLHVAADHSKCLGKRFRVLPLINRIVNPSADLTVTLWIYNDDETEHMHLLHEEITIGGKIQLHDFKRFTLKGPEHDKELHIKISNNNIYQHANARKEKIMSTTLWYNTRHSAEVHFKNNEETTDVTFRLRLYAKQFLRTHDVAEFDLKVALSELLQKPRASTRALIKIQEPQPVMEKSFQELVGKLSGELGVDSCLEIAEIFGLSSNFKDKLQEGSEPGDVLFDELIHEHLVTAASVSALDVALTRTGNVKLAEDVKEYRRGNATFPTTIFGLFHKHTGQSMT